MTDTFATSETGRRAPEISRIGVIGLGQMGGPMSARMVAKGFEVSGLDPSGSACKAAKESGVRILSSPARIASASELIIIVVGFEEQIESILFGKGGVIEGAQAGSIVALGSTGSPKFAKSLAARLAVKSITYLDIPITRGEPAARDGTLLILGGGDATSFERCRPAFSAFASGIFFLGPAPAGQVAKMVNNLILWACLAANDEAFRLAEAFAVDTEALRTALLASSAQNWAMQSQVQHDGMPWAKKDMNIVLSEADDARLSLPLSGSVKEVIKGYKMRLGFGMPRR